MEKNRETKIKSITLHAGTPLHGELTVPGDKSISHRSVMFGALAEGDTLVRHFLPGADCLSTISCFRRMGIQIEQEQDEVRIRGKGLHGLSAPDGTLDAGNSGTTVRLISGILAGQPFSSSITGDASIQKRPMKRIITPLTMMGADIRSLSGSGCAPLQISPSTGGLHGIHYLSPVASAQVKSCVLLAGLYADGITRVTEPALSRDHTERMLRYLGADLTSESAGADAGPQAFTASIAPEPRLHGACFDVPGDISSAAYFIAAAILVPGSEVILRRVGINPTRDGFLRVCRAMGAELEILSEDTSGPEPCADLLVRSGSLHAAEVGGSLIPALIDELPVVAVLAAFAVGTTVIKDAAELKVKESDRIAVVTENLMRMGADMEPTPDGMIIHGGKPLHGAVIDPHADHRIAMSFAVAALAAEGGTEILDPDCVSISYPQFFRDLQRLQN